MRSSWLRGNIVAHKFSFRRFIGYSADSAKAMLSDPTLQSLQILKGLLIGSQAGIGEIVPVKVLWSSVPGPRINLLIPSIKERHVYGGASTALKFFEELARFYENVRLVVTSVVPNPGDLTPFESYELVSVRDRPEVPRQIVALAEGRDRVLPICPGDLFVATVWYTAYMAQRLVVKQSQHFKQPVQPLVYFIQDYEPGFYPFSSQYLLARNTYEYDGPTVAVFNTDLLRQYFHSQNHEFDREYSFEPQMNDTLRNLGPQNTVTRKHKQILVYGRPSVPRNAFELAVEALRLWRSGYCRSSDWKVLSIGEAHRAIKLGGGMKMRALGKLSLENYAHVLSESSVGLSLMVSPHPSYPPLEMAHYGVLVLTNNYGKKNLALWHDNIVSVDESDCSPEYLARSLTDLCWRIEADPTSGWRGQSHLQHYLCDDPIFPFIGNVFKDLSVERVG